MSDGILVKIHGDYDPFSIAGKSIGYEIIIGNSNYLIDCGAPLFQKIGTEGIVQVKGLIVTHCHYDHMRWYTDIILYHTYTQGVPKKIKILSSEDVFEELTESSSYSLDRTLSRDSKNIVDVDYNDTVDFKIIGPYAKYKIVLKHEGAGRNRFCVYDRNGNQVGPDKAKIVINHKTRRPRLLFKDPVYNEWVEPDSFYAFSSDIFYECNKNVFKDVDTNVTIEAIKSPVWHGIPGIGLKVKTDNDTLIFSSDTANNIEIWKQLYSEKRNQKINMSKNSFEAATVIHGDINDFVERMWSKERYLEAVNAFNDGIVIHDISSKNSIVHTDYEKLKYTNLNKEKVILTHSPDRIVSEWVISRANKTYMIKGNSFSEVVDDKLYELNADIYYKVAGKYYVGYKNDKGKYTVYKKNGLLDISLGQNTNLGAFQYKVDLLEDVSGKYFPKLEDKDITYIEREDGRVELLKFTEDGSRGKVVQNNRNGCVK